MQRHMLTTQWTAVAVEGTRERQAGMPYQDPDQLLSTVDPVPISDLVVAESIVVIQTATNTTKSMGQRHAYEYTCCDDAKILGL